MLRAASTRKIAAVVVAVALLAAACGGSDEAPSAVPSVSEAPSVASSVSEAPSAASSVSEAPSAASSVSEAPSVVPSVSEAPSASAVDDLSDESAAEEASPADDLSVCDDPEAEDLGGGFFERDGLLYEMTDVGCIYRPDRPGAEAAENVVADEDHPQVDVEGSEDAESAAVVVICGDGLVLMEEFIAENDNGCRPDVCDHGRGDDGQCLAPEDELLTDEEAAEATDEARLMAFDEYAPGFDCTEVSPGVCEDAEGTLHCHNTNTGWAECPGQPSSEPCPHDDSDPWSFAGSGLQTTGQVPTVTLTPGVWTVTACVRNNDIATGTPSWFQMALIPDLDAGAWYRLPATDTEGFSCGVVGILHCDDAVVNGEWSRNIVVPDEDESPVLPMQVAVTPGGGGSWVMTFTPDG